MCLPNEGFIYYVHVLIYVCTYIRTYVHVTCIQICEVFKGISWSNGTLPKSCVQTSSIHVHIHAIHPVLIKINHARVVSYAGKRFQGVV